MGLPSPSKASSGQSRVDLQIGDESLVESGPSAVQRCKIAGSLAKLCGQRNLQNPESRESYRQLVSNLVLGLPRVSGRLQPALGKVSRRYDRNRELGPDSNLETRFDLSTLGNAQADGRTVADYVVTKRLSMAARQFFDKRKC
jgi:hypothetical protein